MAKPFEKGNQIGKLGGRPAVPQEIRELHTCTKAMVIETMCEYMGHNYERLVEITKDPRQPVYRKFVARVILKGIKDGDIRYLDYICEKFLGAHKLPQFLDISNEDLINGLRAIPANAD